VGGQIEQRAVFVQKSMISHQINPLKKFRQV
jgi:hypothetical protein